MPLLLQAQVTISAQFPPAGFVQKDQLWNLILVNNKDDIKDISIKMNLQDAMSGQIVLSAQTGSLVIGKGVKIITSRDIQPIMYNYATSDFNRNFLPMGAYIACYQVFHNGQKEELLGDECIQINIDPLSPPLLNSPADRSEIQSPYPQFTWMPPSPYDMFTNLNYDIILTEVLPGQSSTEAIEFNTPLYSKSNILPTNENYPTSFSALDTGKIYAWQVIANNGLNYSEKTEVWTFKLAKPAGPKVSSTNNYYVSLEDGLAGTYKVNRDILHIKYFSYDKEFETQVIFTDEKNQVVKKNPQKIIRGDNYFDFDISKNFKAGSYKVIFVDLSNQSHSLKFNVSN